MELCHLVQTYYYSENDFEDELYALCQNHLLSVVWYLLRTKNHNIIRWRRQALWFLRHVRYDIPGTSDESLLHRAFSYWHCE